MPLKINGFMAGRLYFLKKGLVFTFLILLGCSGPKIPSAKLYQYDLHQRYELQGDELSIELGNPLRCPMRIWVQTDDKSLKTHFQRLNPLVLGPQKDTLLKIKVSNRSEVAIRFASRYGDLDQEVNHRKVALPFPKNKQYSIIQGNQSTPTHNTDWSRYAFDFSLGIGDTICAATDGFVVGVVEDYKYGGRHEKWRNFANLITLYDPVTGIFTQYAHLAYKGSLVSLGDSVVCGQAIGLAGMTGYTNIEHLHFNCLKPIHSEDGLISIPIDSIGDYKVSKLRRHQWLRN